MNRTEVLTALKKAGYVGPVSYTKTRLEEILTEHAGGGKPAPTTMAKAPAKKGPIPGAHTVHVKNDKRTATRSLIACWWGDEIRFHAKDCELAPHERDAAEDFWSQNGDTRTQHINAAHEEAGQVVPTQFHDCVNLPVDV